MKKLLVTGGSGFLGGNLLKAAAGRWMRHATFMSGEIEASAAESVYHLDLRDPDEINSVVSKVSPDVIIHTAAMSSLDECVNNKEDAWSCNVTGTENLIVAARESNARFVHVSTDMVFAGDKGLYDEKHVPKPVCYYGRTKLESEKSAEVMGGNHCVARCPLLYGWSQNSRACFTERMIEKFKDGSKVTLFTDEYRNPAHVGNISEILLELAASNDVVGLYNICPDDKLSRYEFGSMVSEVFGLNKELLVPALSRDIEFSDLRPRDCSMVNGKAKGVLKTPLYSAEQGLAMMKADVAEKDES